MSRSEQDALLAYFNTFRLSRRVNTFASLADGKVLLEVMSQITHFKVPTRTGSGIGAGPSENWVLKMNSMKRLYRLLLSCPLPPPQPSLSLTSLPEPNFSSVVRSPTSPDGLAGLVQICRFCLSIGVWANGNEKVIKKIQGLDEKVMAELMRSIEEVMGSLPETEGDVEEEMGVGMGMGMGVKRRSPVKVDKSDQLVRSPPTPLGGGMREARESLTRENEVLRDRCHSLHNEISDLGSSLEQTKQERDDAISRLTAAREASSSGLRSSQTASSEIDRLRADLEIAESNYHRAESALEKQTATLKALSSQVEDLKSEAEEAAKLRDQLDEHRYTAERLQKTENVVEKYKKKLEESASLRRDFKRLEEENSALIESKSSLEAELRKTGGSKAIVENYKSQLAILEKQAADQASEIAELQVQIEASEIHLAEASAAHERDKEELQVYQDRARENELAGIKRDQSTLSLGGTLEAELADEGIKGESKTDLKVKIRSLEKQLGELQIANTGQASAISIGKMLEESNKARDRYQADYLATRNETLRLQAQLEYIRSRGDQTSKTVAALRQGLDEITESRDHAIKSGSTLQSRLRDMEKDLKKALDNLDLVGKDDLAQITSIRQSVKVDNEELESRLVVLQEELAASKERERLHLRETTKLLVEKIQLQEMASSSAGYDRDQTSDHGPGPEHEVQITSLERELQATKEKLAVLERRYAQESRLMLSAWHDLGSRTSRDHILHALSAGKRRAPRAVPTGWLGRQRRYQEDAVYARAS